MLGNQRSQGNKTKKSLFSCCFPCFYKKKKKSRNASGNIPYGTQGNLRPLASPTSSFDSRYTGVRSDNIMSSSKHSTITNLSNDSGYSSIESVNPYDSYRGSYSGLRESDFVREPSISGFYNTNNTHFSDSNKIEHFSTSLEDHYARIDLNGSNGSIMLNPLYNVNLKEDDEFVDTQPPKLAPVFEHVYKNRDRYGDSCRFDPNKEAKKQKARNAFLAHRKSFLGKDDII